MSGEEAGKTPEQSDGQSGSRVFFVLAIAVALPFAVGYLLGSPGAMALVLFGELVAGCFYRPTQIVAVPLFVLLMLLVLLAPFLSPNASVLRSGLCRSNLKQIAFAFHNYHDVYGCFPPAHVADEQGRLMHSWRVLVLPYLEEEALCGQYRFDEPWNGPNNSQLADEVPSVYRCPSEVNQASTDTSYVLVVGDATAWADGRAPRIDEITAARGTSNTILAVEVPNSRVNWMEPLDLTIDQALQRIESDPERHYAAHGSPALNVAFVDGSVQAIAIDELKELLTNQSGERVQCP